MLAYFHNPEKRIWPRLVQRASELETTDGKADLIAQRAREIVDRVKHEGLVALEEYSECFDALGINQIVVTIPSPNELAQFDINVSEQFKVALATAIRNVELFHQGSQATVISEPVETTAGVRCWRRSVPIDRVGLYVPGGTAPLLSVLYMLYVPARLAGCREIVVCTPPLPAERRQGAFPIAAEWVYTASVLGVKQVLALGGAQAIAALAFGSYLPLIGEKPNKQLVFGGVDKIVGPGNQYVTAAKQYISATTRVAIDMPAGPTEMLTIVDSSASADFIAADVLSQLEHGVDSQVLVVTSDASFDVDQLQNELLAQLVALPRRELASQALANSRLISFSDTAEMFDFVNLYAAEHLIVNTRQAAQDAQQVSNAGSVFIGAYTPESLGDYASGTNNTLPTAGAARAYSGVTVDSFRKTITYQQASAAGLESLGPLVETLAQAEQLTGHAQAVRVRRGK